MRSNFIYILICFFSFLSCVENEDIEVVKTLQDVIDNNSNLILGEVIACAGSKKSNNNISYIFYYPVPSANNIQFFETENINVDKNDFSKYKLKTLPKEALFNGYLERFVRGSSTEAWCIITYLTNGKFHKSNPILLKNQTKSTEWVNEVTIDFSESLEPKFIWVDGRIKENEIYFQVVTNSDNDLLSGTYTYDNWFQYYKLSNVVLNVTREAPPSLIKNNNYGFTMMGVSEDNWVNLVVEKQFRAK